jgi:hypothetical protein
MKLIDKGIASLVKQADAGTIAGGNFFGQVSLAPYYDFSSKIPASVQAKVKALTPKVLSGAVKTGVKL